MKKIILSGAILFGAMSLTSSAFAQSIESIAKKAAIDNGCINKGSYDFQVTFLGACSSDIATTSVLQEVLILPKVNPNDAQIVRLAPLARVTMCGDEVISVECL